MGLFRRKEKSLLEEIEDIMKKAEKSVEKESSVEHLSQQVAELTAKLVKLGVLEGEIRTYQYDLKGIRIEQQRVKEESEKLLNQITASKGSISEIKDANSYSKRLLEEARRLKGEEAELLNKLRQFQKDGGELTKILKYQERILKLIKKLEKKIESKVNKIKKGSEKQIKETEELIKDAVREHEETAKKQM